METLNLKLSVQELQTILQALGQLPYVQVQQLIENLQLQATPQLQRMKEAQETKQEAAAKDSPKTGKAV